MAQYLKVEKEVIHIQITTTGQILVGKFTKDKGIRFTDYFNRDFNHSASQDFVVLAEVKVLDIHSHKLLEESKFLAVNVSYIVTATEVSPEDYDRLYSS
jgi:hypothetical protein